jgi:hypothetical protein
MYPRDTIARLLRLVRANTLKLDVIELSTFPLGDLPAAMQAASRQRGLEATVLTMQ